MRRGRGALGSVSSRVQRGRRGVTWIDAGLVVAVPGSALVPDSGFTYGPCTPVPAGGLTEIVFFVLAAEALSEAAAFAMEEDLDRPGCVSFVPGDLDVPDGDALVSAWDGRLEASAAPAAAGRGRGAGRGGRGGRGGGRAPPRRAGAPDLSALERLLDDRLGAISQRLTTLETSRPAEGRRAEGAGPSPGPALLGVRGGRVDPAGALSEARRLLGVGGGGSPAAVAPPRAAVAPRTTAASPSAGADHEGALLQRLVDALEARGGGRGAGPDPAFFGLGVDGAASPEEYGLGFGSLVGGGGGSRVGAGAQGLVNLERLIATRRTHPSVVTAANDEAIRAALNVLPGESWSVSRHAEVRLLPHAGSFLTLKRVAVMLAAALDEGRMRGLEHQHAFLYHAYRVVEAAVLTEGHDLSWAWPLLGIPDPARGPEPGLAPVEAAGLAAFHRDRVALAAARSPAAPARPAARRAAGADPAGAGRENARGAAEAAEGADGDGGGGRAKGASKGAKN